MRKQNNEGLVLAGRIKALRKLYGESQQEHAFRYDVSFDTYGRWERWGPPNTAAHRGYVRERLRVLRHRFDQGRIRINAQKAKKAAKNARLDAATD